MTQKEQERKAIEAEIRILDGVAGLCLYINDYRIAGGKPIGGGRVLKSWKVNENIIRQQLSELCKPIEPEPIGQTDEDLINDIIRLLWGEAYASDRKDGECAVYDNDFKHIATEIAKLLPSSRSQENDVNGILYEKGTPATPHSEPPVNVELLEAAKYFREEWNCEWSKLTAKCDDVNKHSLAIANYEKQMKL